jgi:hypothetical protein
VEAGREHEAVGAEEPVGDERAVAERALAQLLRQALGVELGARQEGGRRGAEGAGDALDLLAAEAGEVLVGEAQEGLAEAGVVVGGEVEPLVVEVRQPAEVAPGAPGSSTLLRRSTRSRRSSSRFTKSWRSW